MNKALFIIAQENYQDHEYGAPKKILEDAGVEVITASKNVGTCTGSFGATTESTLALSDVNVSDYDAIVFIGGSGARVYQHDVQAHLTAQEAGRIANDCNCKKLVLSHLYPVCQQETITQQARKMFKGEVVVASDLMKLVI